MATASAKIRPRVASRFSRIRAGSTTSPTMASVSWCRAPPNRSTISGRTSHSACQPPRPRSSSWTIAPSMALTRPGMRVAAARTTAQATGLRLWGMVEDPPRPSAEGSSSSATSVCMCRERSRAILPRVPVARPRVVATSATRSRCECHGRSGRPRPSSCARACATSFPLSPSAASVPAAPPSCSTSARRRRPPQAAAVTTDGVEPSRRLQAEGRGERLLHPGAGGHRRRAMLDGQPGQPLARAGPAPRRGDRGPGAAAARTRCPARPGWWPPSARSARPRGRPPRPGR